MDKEKQWSTYGYSPGARHPFGIGRIVRDNDGSPSLEYSEQQHFFPELWSKNYIKKFNSLVGAVGFYIKENGNGFDERNYVKSLCRSFPDQKEAIGKFLEKTKDI